MLKIEFQTDNDSFRDGAHRGYDDQGAAGSEVARILRDLAAGFEEGHNGAGSVLDTNGNRVGTWYFVYDE